MISIAKFILSTLFATLILAAPVAAQSIERGNALAIGIPKFPQLSEVVVVGEDGRIPLLWREPFEVVGGTSTEAALYLEDSLQRLMGGENNEVSVIVINDVTNTRAAPSPDIRVVGEVVSPQTLPFLEGKTVWDAVEIACEGVTPKASGSRAKLMRKVQGKHVEIPLNLSGMRMGDPSATTPLLPGDVIVIPASSF